MHNLEFCYSHFNGISRGSNIKSCFVPLNFFKNHSTCTLSEGKLIYRILNLCKRNLANLFLSTIWEHTIWKEK